MFKRRFQTCLGRNQVKYARTVITHVCFNALTFARYLRRCEHLRDPVNVNA